MPPTLGTRGYTLLLSALFFGDRAPARPFASSFGAEPAQVAGKRWSTLVRCSVLLLSIFMSPWEQWTRNTSSLIIATTPCGISIHARLPDPSLPQIPEPHSLVCIYVVALLVTELGPQKVDCSITKKPEKKKSVH